MSMFDKIKGMMGVPDDDDYDDDDMGFDNSALALGDDVRIQAMRRRTIMSPKNRMLRPNAIRS